MDFVLAGNYEQYRHWLGVRNPKDYPYLSGPQQLIGVHGGTLRRIGNWYERQDANALVEGATVRDIVVLE